MCRQAFRTTTSSSSEVCPLAVHCIRQDATNSGVWKRSKLSALEVESYVFTGSSEYRIHRLADVQKIQDGSSIATVATTKKQLESVGRPVWTEFEHPENDYLQRGWHVYVQTTDRGSNELAARSYNSFLYDTCGKHVLYLQFDCLEHATHLCTMAGLAEADSLLPFKYFASSAVLANVLRDMSQTFFPTWLKHWGAQDALQCAKRLFPKCLSGRWGSIHDFEARCIQCTGSKLSYTLKELLSDKIAQKSNKNKQSVT